MRNIGWMFYFFSIAIPLHCLLSEPPVFRFSVPWGGCLSAAKACSSNPFCTAAVLLFWGVLWAVKREDHLRALNREAPIWLSLQA